jgi:hypothetical protein
MAVPKATPTASALSPARRRLVALLQRVNFGRLEGLVVRGGEPVLDPPPAVVREHKFAGENGPRPEAGRPDLALKSQHLDLLVELDRLGDGVIPVLTVKHGLPFSADLPGLG